MKIATPNQIKHNVTLIFNKKMHHQKFRFYIKKLKIYKEKILNEKTWQQKTLKKQKQKVLLLNSNKSSKLTNKV